MDFPGDALFPAQGIKIESFGASGDANRKLDVYRSHPETPETFDSALFSLGGVTK